MRTRSFHAMVIALGQPICWGGCGLSVRTHVRGTVDCFAVVHWADRRWTRRGARRLLLLFARSRRMADPETLNDPALYDWWYVAHDAMAAQRLAAAAHLRLPRSLFDADRKRCAELMWRRGVTTSRWPEVERWLYR